MNPVNDNNEDLKDTFPSILHGMLEAEEEEGNGHIVSWTANGRSFVIHKPKLFADTIMGKYFNQTKYKSFQRQLNLYQFTRDKEGAVKGIYSHPFFVRSNRKLCKFVRRPGRRTKQKRSSVSGGHCKAHVSQDCGEHYDVLPAVGAVHPALSMNHHHQQGDDTHQLPTPKDATSMLIQQEPVSWSSDTMLYSNMNPLPPAFLTAPTNQHYDQSPALVPQQGGSLLFPPSQDTSIGIVDRNKSNNNNSNNKNSTHLDPAVLLGSSFLAEPPVMVTEDDDSTIASIEVNEMASDNDFFDCHFNSFPWAIP